MRLPQVAVLLWGSLLYAGVPGYAQRIRNQGNARVANGHQFPSEIIYPTTVPAAAPTLGSIDSVTVPVSSASSSISSPSIAPSSIFPSAINGSSISTSVSSSTSSVSQSTSLLPSNQTSTTDMTAPTTTSLERRDANPACLDSVEVSCYNLAANCIDSITGSNSIWGIQSCVAAATCYGVGNLITSASCQTGFTVGNLQQGNLHYDIYASIVGSCAWDPNGCPITEQNYIDFYYATLTAISTSGWPSSVGVVTGYWSPILTWAATGTTIPYTNFNDWLRYSSFPTTPPPDPTQPPVVYTQVPWNPNPVPSPGAVSQTFVRSATTTVIVIPTVTVTITVAGATITVAPGGTPVGGMLPTDVTQPDAVFPTFNWNPIPPSTASSVTFTSGTWTSIVAAPTVTDDPVEVDGPPDDGDDDDSNNSWLLLLGLAGLFFLGSIPPTVAVIGGVIPTPGPPPDWVNPDGWLPPPPPPGSNPDPPDDDDDDEDDEDEDVCVFRTLPPYTLPFEGEGSELERRRIDLGQYQNATKPTHRLFKRATRHIVLGGCGTTYTFTDFTMGAADWYTINPPNGPAVPSSSTTLQVTGGAIHTSNDGKVKEHIFEFQFIKNFIDNQFIGTSCAWLTTNLWDAPQPDGRATHIHLREAIDHVDNCVWVDNVLNQVKSSVTNNVNTANAPMQSSINALNTINPNPAGDQIEMYIRAAGMLGQYLTATSGLKDTAEKVQEILGHITPATASYPPMDTKFNDYFSNLMSQYPQRITSRATRVFDYYREKMDDLLQIAINSNPPGNPVPVIPACWPVYHDTGIRTRLNTAGMTWQSHVPASTYHPPCNTAGQTGSFVLFYDAITNVPITYVGDPTFRIVATSTRHFRYARAPPSLSTFYDVNLEATYGNTCAGIHLMVQGSVNAAPSQNYRIATWDQDCTGGQGAGLSNLHPVDDNGNRMTCLFNNFNDGTNTFAIDCGPSQVAIQACIVHVNAVDGVTNAYTSIPFMRMSA
ncbi:hypothetical protein CCMSSC00406_0006337 [Pleurotus cornucopiae]|uniref:Uncharacterized protein n=1 Tax=Pleurotus cornucopiae TaxID=5321 RepID=A0ACB7IPU6_PLECO|nr:hypothetical protein CCMSSC00406_0006337 [Pleurotus cornucopiae]